MKKHPEIRLSAIQKKAIEARNKAQNLYAQGKTSEAVKTLQETSDYSENLASRILAAQILLQGNKVRESYVELKAILNKDSKNLQARKTLCHIYIKSCNIEKLFPLSYDLLHSYPDDPEINALHGSSCHLKGDYPNAVLYSKKAIELVLKKSLKATEKPAPKKESFNKASTVDLLWKTLSQLANSGVHAFPAFGTLLGLVREGGLIAFDKDLDIGIPHSEMQRAHHCMLKHGWVEIKNSFFLSNPRAFYHKESGVSMDVSGFIVDADNGKPATGIWRPGTPKSWNWIACFSSIDMVKQPTPLGEQCWMLTNPEQWLEEIYGDWRTPNPNFDTLISALNMTQFSLIAQSYAFSRIYHNIEKGNYKRALAMTESALIHIPKDVTLNNLKKNIIDKLQP